MKKSYMSKGNRKPRISVNKLAEYLEASSTRRKKIVESAKYPKKYVVTRYKDARIIGSTYLSQQMNEDIVLEAIDGLEDESHDTEFQEQDAALSIEALEHILETDLTTIDSCEISLYKGSNKLVNIAGVDISVNPDLIIKKSIGETTHVGAIKLHISKTSPLSEEGQNIVAVMLSNYTNDFLLEKDENVNPKFCISFDVFSRRLTCCPSAYKLRMKRIVTACEEIALWWSKV